MRLKDIDKKVSLGTDTRCLGYNAHISPASRPDNVFFYMDLISNCKFFFSALLEYIIILYSIIKSLLVIVY